MAFTLDRSGCPRSLVTRLQREQRQFVEVVLKVDLTVAACHLRARSHLDPAASFWAGGAALRLGPAPPEPR